MCINFLKVIVNKLLVKGINEIKLKTLALVTTESKEKYAALQQEETSLK